MTPTRKALFILPLLTSISACSTTPHGQNGNWQGYTESGKASYYADRHENRKTASGEIYRHEFKTAAHKVLPFGTRVRVTNVNNGKSVVVKVNDRGPFVRGRIVDLSRSAFSTIADTRQGIVEVELRVVE